MEDKKINKKQITLNLPNELIDKLKREANIKGYTITDFIIFTLWDYFESIHL